MSDDLAKDLQGQLETIDRLRVERDKYKAALEQLASDKDFISWSSMEQIWLVQQALEQTNE